MTVLAILSVSSSTEGSSMSLAWIAPGVSIENVAIAAMDAWAGWAVANKKEVAGLINSSGKSVVGPESGRSLTSSVPGKVTGDTIASWHLHHLVGPNPYRFSFPQDETFIQNHSNISHYLGVLNAPAGQFTIFGYTPQQPFLHIVADRLGPYPWPQPGG